MTAAAVIFRDVVGDRVNRVGHVEVAADADPHRHQLVSVKSGEAALGEIVCELLELRGVVQVARVGRRVGGELQRLKFAGPLRHDHGVAQARASADSHDFDFTHRRTPHRRPRHPAAE